MPWVGFEPTISAGKRLQTYALDRAATGAGLRLICSPQFFVSSILTHLTLSDRSELDTNVVSRSK